MSTKKKPYLYKKTLKKASCILPSRQAICYGSDRQNLKPLPMRDFKPSIYLKKQNYGKQKTTQEKCKLYHR